MSTRGEKIRLKSVEILKSSPNGLRYMELMRMVQDAFPDIPYKTIPASLWDLDIRLPNEVYKPARGLFRHIMFRDEEIKEIIIEGERKPPPKVEKINEEDFYKPFANWLVNEIEECTKAISLGGNKFKDKWGTPDVIGKREPLRSDIVKGPTEIVSAEIKSDTKDLITAFGQACSYKLFSHKSYIVIPKNSPQDDISKLDALCLIFGVGLVLFDSSSVNDPQFEIRVRPIKHDPDMFYLNRNMKIIEKDLFE
ncbi:MAG: hypothetical protein WAV28_11175 [Sedimentisphaerales bacterium]